jgi:hypothetical protein
MLDVIRLVQGDDKPDVTLQLQDERTETAVDLSAATTSVSVKFRQVGTTTVLGTISCTKIDAVNGIVQFDFSSGVLDDIDAGMYEGEVIISFNGLIHTAYDPVRFRVREDF